MKSWFSLRFCLEIIFIYRSRHASVSLCMIVKNEEEMLTVVLNPSKHMDEIVIVDTGSTDKTKIASSYGAKVVDFEWINDFSAARTVLYVTSDYALPLDADDVWDQDQVKSSGKWLLKRPFIWAWCHCTSQWSNGIFRIGCKGNDWDLVLLPRLLRMADGVHEVLSMSSPNLKVNQCMSSLVQILYLRWWSELARWRTKVSASDIASHNSFKTPLVLGPASELSHAGKD